MRGKSRAAAFLLAGSLLAGAPAEAALVWEKDRIEMEAEGSAGSVTAEYPFRNDGATPVTIQSIQSDCGCTVPTLEKMRYAPGEEGRVAAKFTFGSRTGLQHKQVTVHSDDPASPRKELALQVNIREAFEMVPHHLTWQEGEEPRTQSVTVRAVGDQPVRVIGADTRHSKFSLSIETVAEGKEYRVFVTPTDTAQPIQATIYVQTDNPPHSPRILPFYALVRPRFPPGYRPSERRPAHPERRQ